MRRLFSLALVAVVSPAFSQAPPPALLPPSITNQPGTNPVVPAAAVAAKTYPIARFQNLQTAPPEIVSTVLGMRSGAEWLARQQQPHGRFLVGVNPALRMPLDDDSEFRQATATWAICQSAAFTGDQKLIASGAQAVLGLLALVKADPKDATAKIPNCMNPLGVAACLALAIQSLPIADSRLRSEGESLSIYLLHSIRTDGSIATDDSTPIVAGLVLQALAGSSDLPQRDAAIARSLAYYRTRFKENPHPSFAGTMIPAATDYFLRTKDANAAAMAFEMADWLCASQYGKLEARQLLWAGGFRTDSSPSSHANSGATLSVPGFESAHAARGLAAACQLIRQGVPDLTRYRKYRSATVDAMEFLRSLQYSVDNSTHFTAEFRNQYLLGGIRTALTDGNVRADATALATLAFQRFLESGAEQQ